MDDHLAVLSLILVAYIVSGYGMALKEANY
jgi:hypothetical protein